MMNNRSIGETPRNRRMAIHRLHAPAVCSLLICALLVICALLAASSGWPGSAWAQMPDNRGVKLNPEDSVPPAYLDTLDERDRVRLDAATATRRLLRADLSWPWPGARLLTAGRWRGTHTIRNRITACVAAPAGRPRGAAAHVRSLQPAAARGPPARPARRPDIGSDRRAAADLEQTAADRPHPLSGRQARNGRARHFRHTSRTVLSPCRRRVAGSMRARFMRSTRTIRDRC